MATGGTHSRGSLVMTRSQGYVKDSREVRWKTRDTKKKRRDIHIRNGDKTIRFLGGNTEAGYTDRFLGGNTEPG